jgi:sugar O-acyltransferase (sialic acid O-acetyltransferase NeuD family)
VSKPILLIGGGGHCKVLLEILRKQNANLLGVVAPETLGNSSVFYGLKQYFNDEDVLSFNVADIVLVNGIGSLPGNSLRHTIYEKFTQVGYKFASVISNDALVSEYCILSAGVQVLSGAIINVDAEIGENTIINSGAIVEHDCKLGKHNHVAPGAVLSGNVHTGESVHIGTGACVIQSICIGKDTTVGAGAKISKDVNEHSICYAPRGINRVVK